MLRENFYLNYQKLTKFYMKHLSVNRLKSEKKRVVKFMKFSAQKQIRKRKFPCFVLICIALLNVPTKFCYKTNKIYWKCF